MTSNDGRALAVADDDLSYSALHYLCASGSSHAHSILRLLLVRGYDPNCSNERGVTPLHVAASWGNYETLKLLLQSGADVDSRMTADDGGAEAKTAEQLAADHGHDACRELLRRWRRLQCDFDDCDDDDCETYTPYYFTSPFKLETERPVGAVADRRRSEEKVVSADDTTIAADDKRFIEYGGTKATLPKSTTLSRIQLRCCISFNRSESPPQSPPYTGAQTAKTVGFRTQTASYKPKNDHHVQPADVIEKRDDDSLDNLCRTLDQTFGGLQRSKQDHKLDSSDEQETFATAARSFLTSEIDVSADEGESKLILAECERFSDCELRRRLIGEGVDVGPITNATRPLYRRKLAAILRFSRAQYSSAAVGDDDGETLTRQRHYSKELQTALAGKVTRDWWQAAAIADEKAMMDSFETSSIQSPTASPVKHARGGGAKMFYCYLLLDSRRTAPLWLSNVPLTEAAKLTAFVDAVFYVGKATKARPLQHLVDAANVWRGDSGDATDEKTSRILDVWRDGHGIVAVNVFHNVVSAEAFTREAVIIEAIGISQLTNVRRGHCHGIVSGWPESRRRRLGVSLLWRALSVYLGEGERYIYPKDLPESLLPAAFWRKRRTAINL